MVIILFINISGSTVHAGGGHCACYPYLLVYADNIQLYMSCDPDEMDSALSRM